MGETLVLVCEKSKGEAKGSRNNKRHEVWDNLVVFRIDTQIVIEDLEEVWAND